MDACFLLYILMLLGVDMRQVGPSVKESFHIFKNKIQERGLLKDLVTVGISASMNGKKSLFYKLNIRNTGSGGVCVCVCVCVCKGTRAL